MARERYYPRDNQWTAQGEFDTQEFADAIEADVGATVPLSIKPDGTVIVDFDALDSSVKVSSVKQAIRDNHPHRK